MRSLFTVFPGVVLRRAGIQEKSLERCGQLDVKY